MITAVGPVGSSGMTAAAATKRMCTRNISFTSGTANIALGYISNDITVTKATLFVEVGIGDNLLKLDFGTDTDATAIVASDAIIDPNAGNIVDIPLDPIEGVDVDGGVDGKMLLVSVNTVSGVGGSGQAAIEYHERE